MSLNLSKEGDPIAIIQGSDNDGDKVYLSTKIENDKKDIKTITTYTNLTLKNGKFQQIPNTNKEREIGCIVGASGSGKSTYIKNYIKQYLKVYKKREIFMFSNLSEDETLKDLDIQRIKIGENLLEEPLSVADFEKSLVLFDDIDVISDKHVKEAVYNIMNQILETGRHFKVSCLMTNHLANAPNMKRILNESHFFVYFPWGATRSTCYVLENYIGVDKNQIKKIKWTKSRWATVFKNYPQLVLTEKHIFMLANED
jgi:energy-coupling factor transporter ATP-binding protein EcfA2